MGHAYPSLSLSSFINNRGRLGRATLPTTNTSGAVAMLAVVAPWSNQVQSQKFHVGPSLAFAAPVFKPGLHMMAIEEEPKGSQQEKAAPSADQIFHNRDPVQNGRNTANSLGAPTYRASTGSHGKTDAMHIPAHSEGVTVDSTSKIDPGGLTVDISALSASDNSKRRHARSEKAFSQTIIP